MVLTVVGDGGKEKVEKNVSTLRGRQVRNKESWNISYRVYLEDDEGQQRSTPKSFWKDPKYSTDAATRSLAAHFPGIDGKKFTPKPVALMQLILDQSTDQGDLVLDFFGGSGSFAEAVLNQNKAESIDRNFIIVQLPEPIETGLPKDYEKIRTVSDLAKERIARTIKKLEVEQSILTGESENTLLEIPKTIPKLDLGFKVLKLDRSNFTPWNGTNPNATETELTQQLELHIDPINPNATQEDLLYELLLKSGFMPTEKIETLTLAGKTVYSIAEGSLLICLEDEITRELINAIAAAEPPQFLCLDKAFNGNDQLKANAVQTFSALNQSRDKATPILFKTV